MSPIKGVVMQWVHTVSTDIERPMALNLINPAHGHLLCTLHQAEGLYTVQCTAGLDPGDI